MADIINKEKILVTGGCGYIGSHTVVCLLQAGYSVIILDNLSNSSLSVLKSIRKICNVDKDDNKLIFVKADLTVVSSYERIFENYRISTVIHFAGLKAVGESVENPLLYYFDNIGGTLSLLKCMEKYNVNRIIFSSSATVYGDPQELPIRENFPIQPTNPYGQTKAMIEQILTDWAGGKFGENREVTILRYFNPIGAHESGLLGENPKGRPNNLLPYIVRVASEKYDKVSVFGGNWPTFDGTGVRDYIDVMDLAEGHVAAYNKLKSGVSVYNLGTGKGYSVLEMIKAMEKASGKNIPFEVVDRREGDVAEVYADCSKANEELEWKASRSLETMCENSWKYISKEK